MHQTITPDALANWISLTNVGRGTDANQRVGSQITIASIKLWLTLPCRHNNEGTSADAPRPWWLAQETPQSLAHFRVLIFQWHVNTQPIINSILRWFTLTEGRYPERLITSPYHRYAPAGGFTVLYDKVHKFSNDTSSYNGRGPKFIRINLKPKKRKVTFDQTPTDTEPKNGIYMVIMGYANEWYNPPGYISPIDPEQFPMYNIMSRFSFYDM